MHASSDTKPYKASYTALALTLGVAASAVGSPARRPARVASAVSAGRWLGLGVFSQTIAGAANSIGAKPNTRPGTPHGKGNSTSDLICFMTCTPKPGGRLRIRRGQAT